MTAFAGTRVGSGTREINLLGVGVRMIKEVLLPGRDAGIAPYRQS